jgi:hypothetical protein
VRSEPEIDAPAEVPKRALITKRRVAAVGAVGIAALLAAIALRKPTPEAPLASAPPPETATTAAAPGISPTVGTPELTTPLSASPLAPPDPASLSAAAREDAPPHDAHKHAVRVAPFGNGPVAHGTVLHLKMDGAIEKIEGAQQPTGFTVVLPNRRSLEPAGPLAARDGRIASIRVANDPNGAELALVFKDGVPNYQVRAKGDTLEIAIAQPGNVNDAKSGAGNHGVQAKQGDTGAKPHGKNHKPASASKH